MRNTRQGSVEPNGGENITMQQILGTMRALQKTVATSRMDQERIQVDLDASQARNEELRKTNEELRRNLQQQAGECVVDEQAPPTQPRAFPMPFSQAIMDVVIPATFVGSKATFIGVEDLEAHLTAFHTKMMLSGGFDAVHCKLFMSTLTDTTLDWFANLPDGHVYIVRVVFYVVQGAIHSQSGSRTSLSRSFRRKAVPRRVLKGLRQLIRGHKW